MKIETKVTTNFECMICAKKWSSKNNENYAIPRIKAHEHARKTTHIVIGKTTKEIKYG